MNITFMIKFCTSKYNTHVISLQLFIVYVHQYRRMSRDVMILDESFLNAYKIMSSRDFIENCYFYNQAQQR